MRIKSNFKDYYDGFQANDTDRETLWLRQQKVVDKFDNVPNIIIDALNETTRHWEFLCVAGKVYPFQRIFKQNTTAGMYYTFEDYSVTTKLIFDLNQFEIKSNWQREDRAKWFAKLTRSEIGEAIALHYGPTTYFGIDSEQYSPRRIVTINPRLADFGFAKIMPVHEVYNELYKFVCNMRRPIKPIPEMSNEVRIHQAGFDLKTSFRSAKRK